jgi:lipopolysaccharide transport system ATP-binding protein
MSADHDTPAPAIVVNNLTKEFRIPHERRTTIFENLKGALSGVNYERFMALRNVSFTVNKGDSVGIIGDNGSGKSTLLKVISNILRPTMGTVRVNGKITPFLELGVGFQPDLTARENIEVYSTIMGLSEKEISSNMDSVLKFAGLVKFKDAKLKNFSSGMQVKLAFATAIQKTPDILLIDEVLAVGDMGFQQKCLDIFEEYRKMGVTILFVSHDLSAVRRFCDKTILLKRGRMVAYGKTNDIIDRYVYGIDKGEPADAATVQPHRAGQSRMSADGGFDEADRWGNGKVVITGVKLIDKYGLESDKFHTGDPIKIRIAFHAEKPVDDVVFGISIYSNNILCYGFNTDIEGLNLGTVRGDGTIVACIPSIPLASGKFSVSVAAHSRNHIPYDWHDKKYSFVVVNTTGNAGLIDLKSRWEYSSSS